MIYGRYSFSHSVLCTGLVICILKSTETNKKNYSLLFEKNAFKFYLEQNIC